MVRTAVIPFFYSLVLMLLHFLFLNVWTGIVSSVGSYVLGIGGVQRPIMPGNGIWRFLSALFGESLEPWVWSRVGGDGREIYELEHRPF